MKIKLLIYILFGIFLVNCQGKPSASIQTIEANAFASQLESTNSPQLIDVRTHEEFQEGHIDKAINIDWYDPTFAAQVSHLDKSKPVFVYCKAGGRSEQAAEKLVELGFTQIYNLNGGMMKWNAAQNTQANGKIVGISSDAYNHLIQSHSKVLIDFNAKWCGPCQKMKPFMTALESSMKDEVTIVPLDADENSSQAEQLNIEGLPTLLLYENGKEIWRHVGYISEADLKKKL
jgi:thioredoxin